jgi:hypothetical protein
MPTPLPVWIQILVTAQARLMLVQLRAWDQTQVTVQTLLTQALWLVQEVNLSTARVLVMLILLRVLAQKLVTVQVLLIQTHMVA